MNKMVVITIPDLALLQQEIKKEIVIEEVLKISYLIQQSIIILILNTLLLMQLNITLL